MFQRFLFLLLFIGCAVTAFPQKVEWALVDTKTTEPFHDGIACFKEKVNGVELYGGIDRSGKVVIPPRYKGGHGKYYFEFDGGFAVVTDTNGLKGIINRQGVYILDSKYDNISKAKEADGLYTVNKGKKEGIFYNNRLVIPVEYDYTHTNSFPFVNASNKGNTKEMVFHLFTGEQFDRVFREGNIINARKGNEWRYFDCNGDELDARALSVSSKGLMVFQDTVTKKYGFKNVNTGEIIVAPIYKNKPDELWIYDVMKMPDSNNGRRTEGLIDAAGGEIIKRGRFWCIWRIDRNFVNVCSGSMLDSKDGLYTIMGKELLPAEYDYVLEIGKGLFSLKKGEKNSFYNANTGKMYSGYFVDVINHDGMCSFSFQGKKGYINVETGEIISAKYDYSNEFSEGVALVEKDGKEHLIDKSGRIVLSENDQFSFRGDKVSEGVIGAYDKVNGTEGYIYSPIGKRNYVYNQTTASDATIDRWMAEGYKEFEKKRYATAKEYYYKVIMCAPENVTAIINYGACIGNMGHYDEAIEACQIALDIEPGNKLAAENITIFQNNKKIREERAQQGAQQQETNYEPQRSSTFWDALGAFANAFGNMYGSRTTTTTTNYRGGGTYSSEMTTGVRQNISAEKSPGRGAAYYQSAYQDWERRAESVYRSLTNLGVSFRDKNTGERAGSTLQSYNGPTYVLMKKYLREAQREMQKYRRQAAREGITIPQSVWETATVSY